MIIASDRKDALNLIDILRKNGNNVIFDYRDLDIPFDSLHVDKREFSLIDFIKYVEDELATFKQYWIDFECLVLYSEKSEATRLEKWVEENERWFPCKKTIIVAES